MLSPNGYTLSLGADMATKDMIAAVNRVADALFQQAKAQSRHNKLLERQVACNEEMLTMQRANLAVTQHLEAQLAAQTAAQFAHEPKN